MINSSSGSCHSSDGMCQEIGRTCGSACGCPRPSSGERERKMGEPANPSSPKNGCYRDDGGSDVFSFKN